ncbi:MAG: hypothetical protein K2X66_06485 [Cyanobacteria bacterium]|nr:hypothetical protein [Cyanobacteriota bacterium]
MKTFLNKEKAPYKTLHLEDLPPFHTEEDGAITSQIESYLRKLLDTHTPFQGNPPFLLIPSACDLSSFFHCSELHVFEALQEMGKQVYDYEIRGLDGPICMRDPIGRRSHPKTDPDRHVPWSYMIF